MIELRVGNIFVDIVGEISAVHWNAIKRKLSFQPAGFMFSPAYNKWITRTDPETGQEIRVKRVWDGWQPQAWKNTKRTYFPTGLYSLVTEYLKEKQIRYRVTDLRVVPQSNLGIDYVGDFQLRDYQDRVCDEACNRQRGIIQAATGAGKCLAPGTLVLLYNGDLQKVENLRVGDVLMGPDSNPRRILSVTSGRDKMFTVHPLRGGTPFTVNSPHILSLRMTNGYKHKRGGQIVNISIEDYLKQNKTFKHCAKGYRVPVEFKAQPVPLDPYFLGVWLGDGTSRMPHITTGDSEIVEFLKSFAEGLSLHIRETKNKGNCTTYALTTKQRGGKSFEKNIVLNLLRSINVLNNKHIPKIYKANSREVRLSVLAGLIDTDGSLSRGGFDYISKESQLAEDVSFLARSLGLRATVSPCTKRCSNGSVGHYFRVNISGDCSVIPVRIARKKAPQRLQKKNCLNFGFKVEEVGEGDYYGFEIDGDGLFLLSDFTVTHNTAIAAGIIQRLKVSPFLFFVTSIDLLEQAKESFERFLAINGEPAKVGQIGAGVVDIRDINVITVQTAVRALGKKWDKQTKFDNDDTDDDTPIEDYADDIRDLIRSAEGCIDDEVQHWRADTCQMIDRQMVNAFYKFGMSATPYRDEGDDMMINACFGKKVAVITASELIQKNWLIKPSIKMVNFRGRRCKFREWSSIYKDQIVENEYYNNSIANIANAFIENGRNVLVLVQQINHGEHLASMIQGSTFLSGKSPKTKRRTEIERLRQRQSRCIVSTTIFDEGIDVKPLDTVILAGQGKSKVRAMQRIGRILRPFTDPDTGKVKDKATAIDFCIHQKYLQDHAKEREKMYRTEPEFDIEHIDPQIG